ncbi:uncharacterized protein IL334_007957 [Kwoniella shivajii]|uniref:Hydantoinase n=1 Tax=Kwoniella shivajii TaxID=564305 RepID=A0ABZ1DA46_9TREE|nr:hypothetical protein IL334_007957 [Kwoniella shivajii]
MTVIHKTLRVGVDVGGTNTLVERDSRKLEKVGVIRLCGPHSRLCPPFVSFPYELRAVLEGPVWMVEGGLQVDGREISKVSDLIARVADVQVDVNEIRGICAELKSQGIRTVAVSGVYSPIDHDIKQEELVRDILQAEIPDIKVTISKEVANIAEHFPIKTFSSGPTNSMRGANFLAGLASGGARKETALVIDTEVGVLLPTGFPRQAGARYELCGVALNFSMPHVHSIGLGGGSRVREEGGKVAVGPDSVGYRIDQSLAFGGDTLTATDLVVAEGRAKDVGNATLVRNIPSNLLYAAQEKMKSMIETALESMKTSTQDIPAYLVGGGAILVPDTLNGISKVHRFPFFDAANAVGAACAQVSGVIDTFEDTSILPLSEVRKKVEKRAIEKAVASGADPNRTEVVESEIIPIASAGPWTGAPVAEPLKQGEASKMSAEVGAKPIVPFNIRTKALPLSDSPVTARTILEYKPTIKNKEWILSDLDVDWIAIGCYILGCGGGGSPYSKALALREIIREGGIIKVIELEAMSDDGMVIWGGGIGSPEVSQERLVNEEYNQAVSELIKFLRGRAYPTGWQTTPNVYDLSGRGEMLLPSSLASGDGTVTAMIKNTVSQAWRLGRAVTLANKQSNVGNIGQVLVEALGGKDCAKVLFSGKVTEITRKIYKGHTIGELVIQALKEEEEEDEPKDKFKGIMKSHALGTPDYKYGLRVMVIGVTAAPQWTDTPRGLEIGALGAFGYEGIPYEPVGEYVKPVSVIAEYINSPQR